MDTLLQTCKQLQENSPAPYALVHVVLDDNGSPLDFEFTYLNPAMAALTDHKPEDLVGKRACEMWGRSDLAWIEYFYRAAYHRETVEFVQESTLVGRIFDTVAYPVDVPGRDGYCAFAMRDSTAAMQADAERNEIITTLGRENYVLYLVNVGLNRITPYRLHGTLANTIYTDVIEGKTFSDAFDDYIETYVHPDNREHMHKVLSIENLRETVERGDENLAVTFRRKNENDEYEYLQLRILQLNGCKDDFIIAMRNINESVKESHRQHDLLKEALQMSENANRAKGAFLANMSHDFRTPMNAITGFADIARKHIDDKARVEDCLAKISRSSAHLLNLVNDILDVSSIESGKISTNEAPFDLRQLMEDIRAMFLDQARTRNIQFAVSSTKLKHPAVYGDTVRLNQILVNIIGNAMKFTPEGGFVEVLLREQPNAPTGYGSYVLTVSDNGVGMSEDFVERIWEPFARDKQNLVQRTEGTGLGMAITKNLVEMMNGTISVESKLGAGSTFRIQLPLRLQDDEAQQKTPGTVETAQQADDDTPDVRHFRGRNVLIVDDDDLSREILAETLKEYGIKVDEASNGQEGVDMFSASVPFHYSVVLMDMHMPLLDGDEATRAIRALDRDDAEMLPIIATTADAFDADREAAYESGMSGYLSKPYSARKLVETLDAFLPAAPAETQE